MQLQRDPLRPLNLRRSFSLLRFNHVRSNPVVSRLGKGRSDHFDESRKVCTGISAFHFAIKVTMVIFPSRNSSFAFCMRDSRGQVFSLGTEIARRLIAIIALFPISLVIRSWYSASEPPMGTRISAECGKRAFSGINSEEKEPSVPHPLRK